VTYKPMPIIIPGKSWVVDDKKLTRPWTGAATGPAERVLVLGEPGPRGHSMIPRQWRRTVAGRRIGPAGEAGGAP